MIFWQSLENVDSDQTGPKKTNIAGNSASTFRPYQSANICFIQVLRSHCFQQPFSHIVMESGCYRDSMLTCRVLPHWNTMPWIAVSQTDLLRL